MKFIKTCEKSLNKFRKEFSHFPVFLEVSHFKATQKIFRGGYPNNLGICKVAQHQGNTAHTESASYDVSIQRYR